MRNRNQAMLDRIRDDDDASDSGGFAAGSRGNASRGEASKAEIEQVLSDIEEHLEIADQLRLDGDVISAELLVAIAEEKAADLAGRIPYRTLQKVTRPMQRPPRPVFAADLYQSPWLRPSPQALSSGSVPPGSSFGAASKAPEIMRAQAKQEAREREAAEAREAIASSSPRRLFR
jgi:hypothetical protein